MEDECDCDNCRLARMGIDPTAPDAIQRGGDIIMQYMQRYNCGFPEAIEGLVQERRRRIASALAAISERHGLDEQQARRHFLAHSVASSEVLQ